jgi:hypothetical protein
MDFQVSTQKVVVKETLLVHLYQKFSWKFINAVFGQVIEFLELKHSLICVSAHAILIDDFHPLEVDQAKYAIDDFEEIIIERFCVGVYHLEVCIDTDFQISYSILQRRDALKTLERFEEPSKQEHHIFQVCTQIEFKVNMICKILSYLL